MENKTLTILKKINYLYFIPIGIFNNSLQCIDIFSTNYELYKKIFSKILINNEKNNESSLLTGLISTFALIYDKKHKEKIITGPFLNTTFDANTLEKIKKEYQIEDLINNSSLTTHLSSLPKISFLDFLNYVSFIEYLINGKDINIIDYFNDNDEKIKKIFEKNKYLEKEKNDNELKDNEVIIHNTYELEQQILTYISEGDLVGLERLFSFVAKHPNMNEGILAKDELRQQKNIFIGFIAYIGKTAGIKGGLSIDEAYGMIDKYTLECEKLNSIESISSLRYAAVLDFAKRINNLKYQKKYSSSIYKAITFIKANITKNIGLDDVLNELNVGRTSFLNKFKKETGLTLGKFIIKTKLEESKNLLKYTHYSILEISLLLDFSSQGYFQNLFKKEYHLTPLEYRKKENENV